MLGGIRCPHLMTHHRSRPLASAGTPLSPAARDVPARYHGRHDPPTAFPSTTLGAGRRRSNPLHGSPQFEVSPNMHREGAGSRWERMLATRRRGGPWGRARSSLRGTPGSAHGGQGGEQCRGRASACPALHEGMAWRGSGALQAAFEQYRRSLGEVAGAAGGTRQELRQKLDKPWKRPYADGRNVRGSPSTYRGYGCSSVSVSSRVLSRRRRSWRRPSAPRRSRLIRPGGQMHRCRRGRALDAGLITQAAEGTLDYAAFSTDGAGLVRLALPVGSSSHSTRSSGSTARTRSCSPGATASDPTLGSAQARRGRAFARPLSVLFCPALSLGLLESSHCREGLQGSGCVQGPAALVGPTRTRSVAGEVAMHGIDDLVEGVSSSGPFSRVT